MVGRNSTRRLKKVGIDYEQIDIILEVDFMSDLDFFSTWNRGVILEREGGAHSDSWDDNEDARQRR